MERHQHAPRPTGSATTRRTFLRAAGGTAGIALGGSALSGTLAEQSNGRVVFIYDDGYEADFTETFPVHQQLDAPACSAVPSGVVGQSEKFLSADQLREMTDAGWDVLSHGVNHEALGPVEVTDPVAPGDTRVYVDSTVLGRTPREVELYAGDRRVVRQLTGKGRDETGGYLTLESAVDTAFEPGATVRFTEDVVRSVLSNSRSQLREMGFGADGLVLPYGRWDARTLNLAREYYEAVANVYPGGLNPHSTLNPYRLRRAYFREGAMSRSELGGFMDRVADEDALGILGGHSRREDLTGERIQTAIEFARDRNLEILTLQSALGELGEVPTPTATPTSTPTQSPTATPTQGASSGSGGGGIPVLSGLLEWLESVFATTW